MERLPLPKGDEARRNGTATVIVKAPADVKMTVNGQATALRGTSEEFLTPELKAGHVYSYVFKIEAIRDGKPVTRTQRVVVRAGQKSEVDFSDLAEETRRTAKVTVVLPKNAHLYVDGVAIEVQGNTGTFETPKLQQGKVYHYNMEARRKGEERGESLTQRVKVEAGKEVKVDFTELAAARADLR
jgi:uncharacterized protein (TIGR03000 family)